MEIDNLFEKIAELKVKFQHFYQHRKKITALDNHSSVVKFYHKSYLSLIKVCMNEGFLGGEESQFLEFLLKKYEVSYLDWAHRTNWLKKQMNIKKKAVKRAPKVSPVQIMMDFEKKHQAQVAIPVALLAFKSMPQISPRV